MGRRKERRMAASVALSRRTKLDLFAEPSSNNNGEGGGDGADDNNKEEGTTAKIPNSKPSSGKKQDNPLLLLGQYSDEEEANDEQLCVSNVQAATRIEELVEAPGAREGDVVEALAVQNVKQEELDKESAELFPPKKLEDKRVEGIDVVPLNEPDKGEESAALVADTCTYGMQNVGEVAFGWKLVMHEETNQYYYWNIETGETSWEVPAFFSQGTEFFKAPEVLPVTEEMAITALNNDTSYSYHGELVVYPSMSADDHCDGAHLISNAEEKYKLRDEVSVKKEGYTNENVVNSEFGSGIHQTDLQMTCNGIFSSESIDALPVTTNLHQETDFSVSTRIASYAESLLQRLKDLNRYGSQVQDWDWVSKYIFEIEIRLSDFTSLLPYGSTLHPFWMHSEEKLKGIEHAINVYMSNFNNSGQTFEANAETVSARGDDSISYHGIEGVSELSASDQLLVPGVQEFCSSPNDDLSATPKEAADVSIPINDVNVSVSIPLNDVNVSTPFNDVNVNENLHPSSEALLTQRIDQQYVPSSTEDEDMDVDMELEEEISTNDQNSGDVMVAKCRSPAENFIQSVPPAEWPHSTLEKGHVVPPPPDEEWIPPPPPDAEPVPPPPPDTEPLAPPPPDDPFAPTYTPHPPYTDTVPPLYTEQYNMSYSASASEYYGPTMAGIPSSSCNASSQESQALVSQSSQYFDTVPTTYSEPTTLVVNPMEHLAYYSYPNGTVPLLTAVSGFQSYVYSASEPASHHDATVSQVVNALPESDNISLSHLKGESDAYAVSHDTELLAAQVPSVPTTVQAVTTAAPVALTSGASSAVAPSITAPKAPNKVLRSKRRTIFAAASLRSNKKMSSLVDKWKAAKEELHEDDAYDFLDKKKQKEIEQWRARQIATGEAKGNANFQPLGGDWRERVKRKRGQSSKESVRSPSDAPVDGIQPPDLTDLSRDLPNGWQVFWDESSNKAYYGNTITMETSWTKPIPDLLDLTKSLLGFVRS